jgi:hypothetical protein
MESEVQIVKKVYAGQGHLAEVLEALAARSKTLELPPAKLAQITLSLSCMLVELFRVACICEDMLELGVEGEEPAVVLEAYREIVASHSSSITRNLTILAITLGVKDEDLIMLGKQLVERGDE